MYKLKAKGKVLQNVLARSLHISYKNCARILKGNVTETISWLLIGMGEVRLQGTLVCCQIFSAGTVKPDSSNHEPQSWFIVGTKK